VSLSPASLSSWLCLALALGCAPAEAPGDTGAIVSDTSGVRVSQDALHLGTVTVGDTVTGTVALLNLGDTQALLSISLEAELLYTFAYSPESMVLGADETEKIEVSLTPEGWGNHAATLYIDDHEGNGLFEVAIAADVDAR